MKVRLTEQQKIQVLNAEDIYGIMRQILLRENKIGQNQEHFWVVGLNNQNKILFIELVGLGAVNRVDADPPDVFRMGIYKLAVKMILVHNHPSGDLKPSQADKEATDRLLKVGKLINIEVIDHLIISPKSYISFEDEGLINELKNSGNFEIVKREKAEYQQWKIETKKASDIARKLKEEGIDIPTIKKCTGLRTADIRRL